MKTEVVSFAASLELSKRPDADLLLKKPLSWDVKVIKFATRKALEEFNKKAGLKPVVFTQVPINCAVWAHQSDSDARKAAQ